ncbi:Putative lysophospholipase [Oleispira antarctica RB-8]|uniref:Putative lysophospholipase n=1 Tax=Oleispira antarctica RB-8 TaxID=698738 RepID=R4YQH7_OLEAN|nr:Putative lysophospholipase [Oleispira antarctica RB-8]
MLCLLLELSLPQAYAGENSPLQQQTILIVGDSISAGLGIDKQQGWVALLENTLLQEYPQYTLINASISGETTSGGANRMQTMLEKHQPSIVILELGGNDGLRGTPTKLITKNLTYMINLSESMGAKTLLLGMRIPPNYGQRYSELFAQQYTQLATELNVTLLPFLLEGVAGEKGMMQADGIHPTEEAQPIMLKSVWEILKPMM